VILNQFVMLFIIKLCVNADLYNRYHLIEGILPFGVLTLLVG